MIDAFEHLTGLYLTHLRKHEKAWVVGIFVFTFVYLGAALGYAAYTFAEQL